MPEGTEMLAHPCIFVGDKKGPKKKAKLDPPMKWSMEHPPSFQPGVTTPKWMKAMATWDVDMKIDPERAARMPTKAMWKYNVKQKDPIYRKHQPNLRQPVHRGVGHDQKNT